MSHPDINVATIAQGLGVRKKLQGPTLLFLGARAGALFHSQSLSDMLGAFSTRSPVGLSQTEKFQECIQLLETHHRFNERGLHYVLLQLIQDSFVQDIDRCVAALLKRNFFQLVVTSNIDVGLEDALSQIGMRVKEDFDVFIPGTSSSSVPSFSKKLVSRKSAAFTLVKLYGELAIGHYNFKRRGALFQDDAQLCQQLQQMRKWNMLMVGFDPHWDNDVVPMLFPCTGKIWYVNEERPGYDTQVYKYLQSSNVQYLLGLQGSSKEFFQSLYKHIIGSGPLDPIGKVSPSLEISSLTIHTNRWLDHPAPQDKVDVLLLARTMRELSILLKQYKGTFRKQTVWDKTCYNLGTIGDAHVSLMLVDETEHAYQPFDAYIQKLAPACVIILGTARGFKYKGQQIGSFLISDHVLAYDEIRQEDRTDTIDKDIYFHDRREPQLKSTYLFNLFKAGSIILSRKFRRPMPIAFGPIFSSARATVDRQMAFDAVIHSARYGAIGLETSSASLFSSIQNYQENCLLVEGVSALVDEDKPPDHKIADEEVALENVAQFVLQVIELGGFRNLAAQ